MMANPFAFLRGAAAVMAADLAQQPTAGVQVQAGGDSHLMNFGAFASRTQRFQIGVRFSRDTPSELLALLKSV